MTLEERIKNDLAEFLRHRGFDVVEVISWYDLVKSDGFCETCSYEYIAVDIFYKDSIGDKCHWEYNGPLGELIKGL